MGACSQLGCALEGEIETSEPSFSLLVMSDEMNGFAYHTFLTTVYQHVLANKHPIQLK